MQTRCTCHAFKGKGAVGNGTVGSGPFIARDPLELEDLLLGKEL